MIVKMRKVTLLSLAENREETLHKLRELGAVHLSHIVPPSSNELEEALGKLKLAKSMQIILDSYRKQSDKTETASNISIDPKNIIDEAVALNQAKNQLGRDLDALKKEKQLIEPYGNFDPGAINALGVKGLYIKLYKTRKKEAVVPPENTYLFTLSEDSENLYQAVIGKNDFQFTGEELPLPERSLEELNASIESIQTELKKTETRLIQLGKMSESIRNLISRIESDIELIEARDGMGASGKLCYIQGFCPVHLTDQLLETAKKNGWGLVINDPSEEDMVPTLIKSPAWVKPIKSLFTLLDISPGYREIDIRPVFYISMGLFFAILIGDAGYGFLFLAATFMLRAKFKKAPAEPFILSAILSVCAIIWGILAGSYFGIEHLPPVLNGLKLEWLSSETNLMMLSFLIGAIHLTIAHAWRALLTINSTRALGQIGWICITWSAYSIAGSLILGAPLASWFWPAGITGLMLVIVFMKPFKLLKTEWSDHVMLPFSVIGNFADLVSYVRLFAVGSASLAVAEAFNELAVGNGINSLAAGIAAAFVLFLGHSLNIILGLMSILVHGVRLNTLEFSGHIGLEWSGFKYKPFAEDNTKEKD